MIEKIEREVEESFNESDISYCGFMWFYKNHLCVVKDIALRLAEVLGADKKIIHLTSILHDIGYLTDPENHVESGIKESKLIMKKHGIGDEIIDDVLYCIKFHDKLEVPATIEARIIQFADALAYTDPGFLSSMKKIKGENFDKFLEKKRKKLKWVLGWNNIG